MKSSTRVIGPLFAVLCAAIAAQALAQQSAEETPGAPFNPYVPPACAGIFTDVACPGGFAVTWIEKFYGDGITSGCGTNPLMYCPDNPVTRAQMAVFVEKAMRGTAAWSPGDLGSQNTGLGAGAMLAASTSGQNNTGVGYHGLQANTSGGHNTAVGTDALAANTTAGGNVALGAFALSSQSYSPGSAWESGNTAVGYAALTANQPTTASNGFWNTAVGSNALQSNTRGYDNTAIGWKAGARGGDVVTGYAGGTATFVDTVTGWFNTFVGINGATVEVNNCTAVGMDAYCDASNEVRLGNAAVTSIGGKVAWSALSDARAKSDIRDLDLGLDFVLALRPVSFRYKNGNGRTDMGFIAQDVEALMGDDYNVLGIGGDTDRTLSLRYTDLIAPIVKAIKEQQATIEAQQAEIQDLKARLAQRNAQQSQIEAVLARVATLEAAAQR